MITVQQHEGTTYYVATNRGVEYTAYILSGRWYVHSRRLALGRMNCGSGRYFDSVEELSSKIKAFKGLDILLSC